MLEASAGFGGGRRRRDRRRRVALARTYSDVADEEGLALVASSGFVEIAVNGGSAARRLGAKKGSSVHLRLVRPQRPVGRGGRRAVVASSEREV